MATKFNVTPVVGAIERAAGGAVIRAIQNIRNEAIRLVSSGGRTGRVYRRRGGIVHQASAPGEPPASEHGASGLVGHITTEYFPSRLAGRVTARTAYASYLEFGTRRMEPRPFMRPTVALLREGIVNDIKQSVGAALRKIG